MFSFDPRPLRAEPTSKWLFDHLVGAVNACDGGSGWSGVNVSKLRSVRAEFGFAMSAAALAEGQARRRAAKE